MNLTQLSAMLELSEDATIELGRAHRLPFNATTTAEGVHFSIDVEDFPAWQAGAEQTKKAAHC